MGTIIATTTPRESSDLTSLAKVKARLGITDGSSDAVLNELITAASLHVETITGRTFARERITEVVPGYGTQFLQLCRTPVKTIHSILQASEPVIDHDINKSNLQQGAIFREVGWEWKPMMWWDLSGHYRPGTENPEFVVDYTSGYSLPSYITDTSPPVLPGDVEQYVIELITNWFNSRSADGTEKVKSLRIETLEFSFADTTTEQKDRTISFIKQWSALT